MGIDACMLVKTSKTVTREQVRRWAYELASAFGGNVVWVSPPHNGDDWHHCLEIVDEYRQDGEPILPAEGETLIEVSLFGRYYGVGYERGNLPTLLGVAQWLEDTIPGASVYYGGDSSGVCAELFDAEARRELWAHFVKVQRHPYTHSGNLFRAKQPRQACDFCGGAQMCQCRWGAGGTGYVCHGCELHRLVAPDGTVTEAYRKWPDETSRRGAA